MNSYEIVLIAQPDLDQEGVTNLLERFTNRIESLGGQISTLETWGKRRLAYPIRKFREGFYYITHFKMDPKELGEVDRFVKLTEPILRYLIIRQQDTE